MAALDGRAGASYDACVRPRVFVTRMLPGDALERLAAKCAIDVWQDEMPPPRAVLLERSRDCEGLLTLLTDRIDRELLERCPKLRAVSNLAVGYDNVDVPACTERGIPVGHTPGVLTETVADFAFALMLAAARRLVEGDAFARSGRWRTWHPSAFLGLDVHGSTLGIAGFGATGQALARRATGFGMRVLFTSRSDKAWPGATRVDKDTLFRESDFVSLHVPLTPETRHYAGERELSLMKPTAILVNTARGGVVDQQALVRALRDRRIAAAGLDVTDPEPPSADEPLLLLPNVVIAPHIASASHATRARMAGLAAENLLLALEGRPMRHCVNPQVRA